MFCHYISHHTADPQELSRVKSEQIKQMQPFQTVCIKTCHRIEFYSTEPFSLPTLAGVDAAWTSVRGLEHTLLRLARLSTGLDSKILGESFIAHQCIRPFLKSHLSHLPFSLISGAFDVASRLKRSFGFDTSFSYDDAAFSLLEASTSHPRPTHLVVFGAGLLGQSILKHNNLQRYTSVHLITRDPNTFLQSFRPLHLEQNFRVSTLTDAHLPTRYDCIIATDNPQLSFISEVHNALRRHS
jgi:glutamyl-tRNA reductase